MSIFTHSAISPSSWLRQLRSRYAIRAGRNLPDKELRYLRIVIVTTDIHEGLQQSPCNLATTQRRCLTFSHWSSVTPYTFSYEFAGSCVFVKQLPEILSLRPILLWASLIPKLRLLFCRVPWRPLTRSPWSTRPDHLCRFAVRFVYS